MSTIKYTGKQDVVKRGIIKKNGVFYKQSLLEVWHAKGWLEFGGSKYSSDDRLRFGLKLALDYQIISRANLHSSYIFNNKIDLSANVESRAFLDAKDSYSQAVKSVPAEFWKIVRQICIEEREPVAPAGMSERQKTYFYFLCRTDLCRGLDRIIKLHTSKLKNVKNDN